MEVTAITSPSIIISQKHITLCLYMFLQKTPRREFLVIVLKDGFACGHRLCRSGGNPAILLYHKKPPEGLVPCSEM